MMAVNTSLSKVNSLPSEGEDENVNVKFSDDEVMEVARDWAADKLFELHQQANEQLLVEDFAVAKSSSLLKKDSPAVPAQDLAKADEETGYHGGSRGSVGSEILETPVDKDQGKEERTLSSLEISELSDWYLRTLLCETAESTRNGEDSERSSVSFDDSQYSCGVYVLEAGTVKYGHRGDDSILQFDVSIDSNRNEEMISGQQDPKELIETTAVESPSPDEEVRIDEVCDTDPVRKLASSPSTVLQLFLSAIFHYIRRYLY